MLCQACGAQTDGDEAVCAACGASPLLDGRYRLDTLLGAGGQATTYRATRLADGAVVAIKELLLRRIDDWKVLDLFEREARVLQSIEHPAVPRYLDQLRVGSGKQTAFYLVQELVQGESLEALRRRRRLSEPEIARLLADVADVLHDLHALRPPVVHRDIKPSNIMVRSDGKVALIDFGSVQDVVLDRSLGGATIAGTFGYMAPEQFAGQASPASDLYALGATAVTLLTGRPAAELIDAGHSLRWREAVVASPGLVQLLAQLLASDPGLRPKDARQVAAALRAVAEGRASTGTPAQAASSPFAGLELRDVLRGKVDMQQLLRGVAAMAQGAPQGPPPELYVEPPPAPRKVSLAMVRKRSPGSLFNLMFGSIFGGIGYLVGGIMLLVATVGEAPWQLALAGAGALLIFGGIGTGIFVHGWRRMRAMQALMRHGKAATGQIIEVQRDRSIQVNGRSPFSVRYSFVVDGATCEGEVHSWLARARDARPGQPVAVIYDPAEPAQASVAWLPE